MVGGVDSLEVSLVGVRARLLLPVPLYNLLDAMDEDVAKPSSYMLTVSVWST